MKLLLICMWRNFLPFPSILLNFTSPRALQYSVISNMQRNPPKLVKQCGWCYTVLYEYRRHRKPLENRAASPLRGVGQPDPLTSQVVSSCSSCRTVTQCVAHSSKQQQSWQMYSTTIQRCSSNCLKKGYIYTGLMKQKVSSDLRG